jgi:uncharacterized protein
MGEVKRYPQGTFCWIDLGTTDVPGARAFYGGLFGWDFEDLPAGDGATYTMCRLQGLDVTGIHEHSEEEGTRWSSSIAVDDVDATSERARDLGATVTVEPFDLPGTARMSVIRDPAGAEVGLWQAKGFEGARLVNEVGTWTWNELATPDVDAASAFYTGLFAWAANNLPAPMRRASFALGDLLVGGVHALTEQEAGAPPRWTVSFRVADADHSVEKVRRLGGTTLLPPMDVPAGRFSVVADPNGAAFTVTAVPAGAFRGVDGS